MRDFDFHATHFSISEIIMDQGIFCATRFFACEDSASISSKKLVCLCARLSRMLGNRGIAAATVNGYAF
jgi:hypothetical protein